MEQIIENFRFLAIEAENQIKLTYGLLSDFQPELLEKIASKDDYIDNLKTTIENTCFSEINALKDGADKQKRMNTIRALHIICINMERIADYCVNIARQTQYLSDMAFLHRYDYRSLFAEAQRGVNMVSSVFDREDLAGALEICRIEFSLDQLYKVNFDRIMDDLRKGKNVANLITVIFIFRYLERIGDSILNMGEALVFAIIGDRIKIRQINALEKTLSESGFKGDLSDIDFASIWGSRSGCRISKVGRKKPSGFQAQGIFKEGSIKKVKTERENMKRWDDIFPGLAPRIFGYYEKHETASLLVEFLSGCTLDQVILTEPSDVIRNVIFILEQTLGEIWERTRKGGSVQTDYMDQLASRLATVYRVHPSFDRHLQKLGNADIRASKLLIEQCREIEKQVPAPFTVFIHGDFNTNNVVYNHSEQKINYIDLYRSRDADYVQDASVFIVSNFRLPVFDPELRERLNTVVHYFYEFFTDFAEKNNDETFQIRLTLALIRSFYTSTRFDLNYDFAKEMFMRSHYLMEKVVSHSGKPWEEFRIPDSILYY